MLNLVLCIVQSNETVLIRAGEAYKPACREFHKYFSLEKKENLNKNEIIKKSENNEKEKDL